MPRPVLPSLPTPAVGVWGVVALALAGCGGPEPTHARWLTGFDLGWDFFNHRVSSIDLRPTPADGDPDASGFAFAFVGGVSTTAVSFYDDTCPEGGGPTCDELPTLDYGSLTAQVARASSTEVVLADASVRLPEVGAEPVRDTVRIVLPREVDADEPATAWVGGFSLWTGVPLPAGAPSCYDPRHGWLPTRMQLAVVDAAIVEDGAAVDVTVEAAFEAGLTLEAIRACLDAVADLARVRVDLDVVVAVGGEVTSASVGNADAWPRDPLLAQEPPPDGGDVSALGGLRGWRSLDWRFHVDDPEGRGAYLRTLGLRVAASGDGGAAGWATNVSATMLSGFDYTFAGEVVAVPGEVVVEDHEALEVPAAVDAAGEAVRVDLP